MCVLLRPSLSAADDKLYQWSEVGAQDISCDRPLAQTGRPVSAISLGSSSRPGGHNISREIISAKSDWDS